MSEQLGAYPSAANRLVERLKVTIITYLIRANGVLESPGCVTNSTLIG